jgi:hypothetical protein
MPSGWDVYYIVFLSALVALGIPLVLALVSRFVSRQAGGPIAAPAASPLPSSLSSPSSHDRLGRRINARFFLGINATLALIALLLILIPCVGVIRNADGDKQVALRALFAIVSVAGLAGLGLLYSSRKGDLSWIRSYQETKSSPASFEEVP